MSYFRHASGRRSALALTAACAALSLTVSGCGGEQEDWGQPKKVTPLSSEQPETQSAETGTEGENGDSDTGDGASGRSGGSGTSGGGYGGEQAQPTSGDGPTAEPGTGSGGEPDGADGQGGAENTEDGGSTDREDAADESSEPSDDASSEAAEDGGPDGDSTEEGEAESDGSEDEQSAAAPSDAEEAGGAAQHETGELVDAETTIEDQVVFQVAGGGIACAISEATFVECGSEPGEDGAMEAVGVFADGTTSTYGHDGSTTPVYREEQADEAQTLETGQSIQAGDFECTAVEDGVSCLNTDTDSGFLAAGGEFTEY